MEGKESEKERKMKTNEEIIEEVKEWARNVNDYPTNKDIFEKALSLKDAEVKKAIDELTYKFAFGKEVVYVKELKQKLGLEK